MYDGNGIGEGYGAKRTFGPGAGIDRGTGMELRTENGVWRRILEAAAGRRNYWEIMRQCFWN